ncbi:uncharacterized protein [Asterias amurensis]|uniref:uncharacterized protein n=1 Tax=Asterias amurensis TaxID=7602 RepID=UPI003AB7BDE4
MAAKPVKDTVIENVRGKIQLLVRQNSKMSDVGVEFERDPEELTLCFLCQKDLTVPKILPCLHTFCKSCLVKYAVENEKSGSIRCPQCKDQTSAPIKTVDIGALPDNSLVSFLQGGSPTDTAEKHNDVQCTSCNHEKPASSWCANCQDFLCESCFSSHESLKVLRNHKVVGIEEWRKQNGKTLIEEKLCHQHNGEPVTLYCGTCKTPMCKDCADLDHSTGTHRKCSLLEGAVICRRSVEKLMTISRQTEAKFKGAWEILDTMKSDLRESTQSLRKEVEQAFKDEIDALNDRKNEFLTKIDVIETQRQGTLKTHVDNVENILEQFWTAFDLTESLMDNGNDFHVLILEPIVCERLKSLYKKQPELPHHDLTVVDLTEETEEGREEEQVEEEEVDRVQESKDTKEEEVPVWELETTLGDRGAGEGQFDWCRGVAASLDGDTVVADWGNDRVQVFNNGNTFTCVLNSDKREDGKISMPQDVACLLDGRFVVIDKSHFVKVYDPNGKFLYRFSTLMANEKTLPSDVELSCVTVDRRSRIVVGDCKRNLVTIHYIDGKLIKTVPAVGPGHIATTSTDLLVVSCPRKQKVRVMNHDGRFVFQVDTFGLGEKLKPRGVACDNDNNIYVVHKERGGEKSVHMFNSHGKYEACVAKNLREPYDVDIAPGGKVIVSDDDAVKVFSRKYKK